MFVKSTKIRFNGVTKYCIIYKNRIANTTITEFKLLSDLNLPMFLSVSRKTDLPDY